MPEPSELRNLLSDATAAAEAAESERPAPSELPAEPQRPAAERAAPAERPGERPGDRARGPDGKFLPRAEGAGDDDSSAAEEAPEEPGGEEPEAEAPPQPTVAVPTHWSQADKDLIGKLPAEHRQAVVDRYKAIEAGYTPKLMRAADLEKQFAGAEEVFRPYAEILRQRNQTPSDVVRAWATVEQGFLEGAQEAQAGRPNQKGALLVANLIRNYQVDPGAVAEILQRGMSGAPPSGTAMPPAVPPELMQEITSLKQWKSETERTIQAGREADAQRQIDAFAAAKDARGNPLYPYFAELEPEIIRLAQVDASERKPLDLADLYDRAAYANRETRAKLLSASAEEQKRQAAADRKARAAAAQRASSSVTGSAGAGQSPSEGSRARSLREELEMNAAEHEAA